MRRITITDGDNKTINAIYLYTSLSEVLVSTNSKVSESFCSGRAYIFIDVEDKYYTMVKGEIEDKIADIITISYKNEYMYPLVNPEGLSKKEKELFISGLISADLEDDKRYVIARVKDMQVYAVDGILNFRLKPLKEKWKEVISYIPTSFTKNELKEFMGYLLEDKVGKTVYVNKQMVYDSHFKRLIRSYLLGNGKLDLIKEIILSCSGRVELSGEIPKEDEMYLREYYTGKITTC